MRAARTVAVCLTVLLAATTAFAQFQTCVFCDVMPTNPDPFRVDPCQSGSITLRGIGFQDTNQNGCNATPMVTVRSTRSDRLNITSFRVISDTEIQVFYSVPCNATGGLVGIDVRIDDDPADAIEPYACGNNRVLVNPILLAVVYDDWKAVQTPTGVFISWTTLSEEQTLGFDIWMRTANGVETRIATDIQPHGPRLLYSFLDARPTTSGPSTAVYQIEEFTADGPGDATPWFAIPAPERETLGSAGSRGRTSTRRN